MFRRLIACGLCAIASPLAAQASEASLKGHPPAMELFERDWALMNWALKFYDADRDILIKPEEARMAADAFRKLADADNDGRITPHEYRDARAFILARY